MQLLLVSLNLFLDAGLFKKSLKALLDWSRHHDSQSSIITGSALALEISLFFGSYGVTINWDNFISQQNYLTLLFSTAHYVISYLEYRLFFQSLPIWVTLCSIGFGVLLYSCVSIDRVNPVLNTPITSKPTFVRISHIYSSSSFISWYCEAVQTQYSNRDFYLDLGSMQRILYLPNFIIVMSKFCCISKGLVFFFSSMGVFTTCVHSCKESFHFNAK